MWARGRVWPRPLAALDFGPSWGQWQPCWVLRVQSGEMAPGSTGWEMGARHQKGETGGLHMARMGQHPQIPSVRKWSWSPRGLGGNAEPTTLASHDQHMLCAECSTDAAPSSHFMRPRFIIPFLHMRKLRHRGSWSHRFSVAGVEFERSPPSTVLLCPARAPRRPGFPLLPSPPLPRRGRPDREQGSLPGRHS